MLRQDPASTSPEGRPNSGNRAADSQRVGSLDIQRELNRLEEMILDSPRFLRRTLINEDDFLDQLDLVRLSLPEAFHQAVEIVQQREDILDQAEQYAQDMIEAAEQRAMQILNETGIVQRAEHEAQQIRTSVQQECEAIQQQTLAEIDRMRLQAQQDLGEMRRRAIEECEDIQIGADEYADKVLRDMEAQMNEMLRIIRNGRQQLQINQPPVQSAPARPKENNPAAFRSAQKGGERKS